MPREWDAVDWELFKEYGIRPDDPTAKQKLQAEIASAIERWQNGELVDLTRYGIYWERER